MIGHIDGDIIFSCDKYIILDVNGIGYKVYVSLDTISTISGNNEVALWTHLVVKEDALDLYGFLNQEELEFFKLLIGISGIGPKGALGIMSVASLKTLCSAIRDGDTSYLTKVSGIGKKNAQKIILELKDKVSSFSDTEETLGRNENVDVVEALKSLGYKENEAREAVKKLPPEIKGTAQKVTEALKLIGK
ncbi:MAG: Holliday junction branch migration protein RuvA [Candidatus Pacebacteria bacterium]|nr:Holliday junction branch migration protein RuvA [Candidatus Paceibacterota bacterium]